MNTENQQNQNQNQNGSDTQIPMPTPEQLAARDKQRVEMREHYKKEIQVLKVEAEYNELQERIEKARYNAWQWRIRFEQMMAPDPNADQGKDTADKQDKAPETTNTEGPKNTMAIVADSVDKGTDNVVAMNSIAKEEKVEETQTPG